jgi:hypothetical protein
LKVPLREQLKNHQIKVQLMLSMSICCNTCRSYTYKPTEFSLRNEDVKGEVRRRPWQCLCLVFWFCKELFAYSSSSASSTHVRSKGSWLLKWYCLNISEHFPWFTDVIPGSECHLLKKIRTERNLCLQKRCSQFLRNEMVSFF